MKKICQMLKKENSKKLLRKWHQAKKKNPLINYLEMQVNSH